MKITKEQLLSPIITLYKNGKKELSEKPIATTGVLATLIFVIAPMLLSEYLRGFVLYHLSGILKPQIEVSLFPLLITVMSLVAIPFALHRNKKIRKNHLFLPFDKFAWKVRLYGDNNHRVDETPYCKQHQIKLVATGNSKERFTCPFCGSDSTIHLPFQRKLVLLKAVQNLERIRIDRVSEASHDLSGC